MTGLRPAGRALPRGCIGAYDLSGSTLDSARTRVAVVVLLEVPFMPRFIRHLFVIFAVLLALGCSGGGCSSGCSGCGITPLAEGFASDARIENAGSARLTESG